MDKAQIDSFLSRGVANVIVESELRTRLEEGAPLRLKMGFDPSAPDLHVGHAVGLRKLRQLQEMGRLKMGFDGGDHRGRLDRPDRRSQRQVPDSTHAHP